MADDIFVRFGADIDPLKRGTKEASSSLEKFGDSAKKTSVNLAKMATVAVAAGAAIGVKLVKDSLDAIDAQAKLGKQLRTTSASIAVLERATDRSGISMSNVETAAKNLDIALGEAAQGGGVALETLDRIGVSAKDLEGMTLDQKFISINEAIKKNIPVTERAAASADLFGKKAGFAIMQLDQATIDAATREVVGFGVALSDVDAAKIENANDAMGNISLAVTGVSNQLTVALAPILEHVATLFKDAAIESGGFKEQAIDAVEGVATAVGFIGNAFTGIDLIIDGVILAFQALKASALAVSLSVAESVDSAVMSAVANINGMIDSVNNIPGVDVARLIVGESELTARIKDAAISANEELAASTQALHNKLMAPLPSEQVEAFIASINDPAILEAKQLQVDSMAAVDAADGERRKTKEEEIQSAMALIRQSWGSNQTSAMSSMFGDLATLQQSGNKRMFEIGKKAAMAQTLMSTYEGAQKAYTAMIGIPVIGPALATAAAGAAIVAGGVRLQSISSTSFGGGGSVNASAGGGSGAAAAAPVAPAAPAQNRTVSVQTLDPSALVSGSMVNSIAEQLVDLQNDGFKLVV